MSIREDLLFDFAVSMPRVLVSGETTVLDHVKKVMILTDSEIVVFNGQKYTSVSGHGFVITLLKEERMLVSGEVEEIRFFMALQEDKDRRSRSERHDKQVHKKRGGSAESEVGK